MKNRLFSALLLAAVLFARMPANARAAGVDAAGAPVADAPESGADVSAEALSDVAAGEADILEEVPSDGPAAEAVISEEILPDASAEEARSDREADVWLTAEEVKAAAPAKDANAASVRVTAQKSGNEQEIFDFLTEWMGLNTAAASGVLANLFCESKFSPGSIGDHGTSCGICQWHNGRRNAMLAYLIDNGYEPDDLRGQLNYLREELKERAYADVYDYLKKVPDTADGALDAAKYFCVHFEKPGNVRAAAKVRGNLAKNTYWEAYAENVDNPTILVQLLKEGGVRTVDRAGMRMYLREEGIYSALHREWQIAAEDVLTEDAEAADAPVRAGAAEEPTRTDAPLQADAAEEPARTDAPVRASAAEEATRTEALLQADAAESGEEVAPEGENEQDGGAWTEKAAAVPVFEADRADAEPALEMSEAPEKAADLQEKTADAPKKAADVRSEAQDARGEAIGAPESPGGAAPADSAYPRPQSQADKGIRAWRN